MTVQKRKLKSILKISNPKNEEPKINRSINLKRIKEKKNNQNILHLKLGLYMLNKQLLIIMNR